MWAQEEIDREWLQYEEFLEAYARYVEAIQKWRADPAVSAAPQKLLSTVRGLEARGLLQYDASARKFDLHPIVRALVSPLDQTDERRIREIFEQGEDADTESAVPEPDASAIVQNPLAVTFEPDDEGRIGIASQAATDRLLDDADSRDRHAEVLREARAALHASRHGATQASDMASPIADYIEALGAALLDIRPSLLILRGEKLRRLTAARAGPDSFAAPLSEDQANALDALRIAHNLLVGLDPYLTRIERATYDPDTPIVSINIEAMHVVVGAVESADIATEDAGSVLKDSVANIPPGAPAEDRRAKSAMENLANFARAIVKAVKFGWRVGAVGAKLGGEASKLAKFVKSNISVFDHVFAGYQKILDILHWVASLLP